ncbi:MAG: alanine--tRNA ligase-related protein, partial [Bacillota bacterium]|nr:alanine--tRNA ligase-related protein [Bacillota bacterium]
MARPETAAELRRSFLQFFSEKGHAVVPSSSLVPAEDPTLLFTNAGMVQFKDFFTGSRPAPYPRAVSV